MSLTSRLKKLEKAVESLPCPTCRNWWQQPIVLRDEKDPPAPRDPHRCPRCGRKCPEGKVFEIIIAEQIVPAGPFEEEVDPLT